MGRREVTPKQKEIAQLMVEGKDNKKIAQELGMSPGTLRAHQQHMRQVTGQKKTEDAARAIVNPKKYGAAGQQSGGCSVCKQPGGRHLPNCTA